MTSSGTIGTRRNVCESFEAIQTHRSGTPAPRSATPTTKPTALNGSSNHFIYGTVSRYSPASHRQQEVPRHVRPAGWQHALLAAAQEAQADRQRTHQGHEGRGDLDREEAVLGPVDVVQLQEQGS